MARAFKPSFPYSTAILLLTPSYTTIKGVPTKSYDEKKGVQLNCSFKTFGGTDNEVNGVYVVEDTANVETWYRPDITSECRIKLLQTGQYYEVIGAPENIDMRNQFCAFKVRAIKGGV